MTNSTKKQLPAAMMDIVEMFLESGGTRPIDLDVLSKFALQNDLWNRQGDVLLKLCKREFSRAFREQYHVDPQGRTVRTYHAARTDADRQSTLWDDMRLAPSEHMVLAFSQRRRQIVGECSQLKRDVDSYNDNNKHGGHYQLVIDFTYDVAEGEQSTEYVPTIKPR